MSRILLINNKWHLHDTTEYLDKTEKSQKDYNQDTVICIHIRELGQFSLNYLIGE